MSVECSLCERDVRAGCDCRAIIEAALDDAYPAVADELKRLAGEAKGMDGRGMCRRFLRTLVWRGWTVEPPEHVRTTSAHFSADSAHCAEER